VCCQRVLVGAVGIENNAHRSSKDLDEMLGNDKTLRRHAGELNGIPIGPSMAPRYFESADLLQFVLTSPLISKSASDKTSRRGWQADDYECHSNRSAKARAPYGFAAKSNAFSRTRSRPFLRSLIVVCTSMSGLMPTPSNSEPSGKK